MHHKGEFITCHYLSLWHPRWHFDPLRGHFTALDFSVYVCTFAVFFHLYQLPPRDKSVSHSDSSVHLQALNPTQHWLNLFSSVLFISITMADSFEIKFTYVFLLFSNFFLEEEAKLYQFYAIKFGERKKKGESFRLSRKRIFSQPTEPQWDPVRQRVEETLQK